MNLWRIHETCAWQRFGGNPRKLRAYTFLDLIVGVATLFVLVGVVLPMMARGRCGCRPVSQRIACYNNLKQVGISFRTWALDNNDKYPAQVSVTNGGAGLPDGTSSAALIFQVMSNELSTPLLLACPGDRDPILRTNRTFSLGVGSTNLSYFAALDADAEKPELFLSGDNHMTIGGKPVGRGPSIVPVSTNQVLGWRTGLRRHQDQGNVGLADGSVQQFTGPKLTLQLRSSLTQTPTQRLAFP